MDQMIVSATEVALKGSWGFPQTVWPIDNGHTPVEVFPDKGAPPPPRPPRGGLYRRDVPACEPWVLPTEEERSSLGVQIHRPIHRFGAPDRRPRAGNVPPDPDGADTRSLAEHVVSAGR